MKRAILVSTGTLAGLAAVLSYSGAEGSIAIAAGPADNSSSLGGPPPISSTDPTSAPPAETPAAADPTASQSTSDPTQPSPSASTVSAAPAASPSASASKKSQTTTPTSKPTATSTATSKPTPTPSATATGPKDYVGSLIAHKYGSVQVGIRVQAGKITAAWSVVFPDGASQPYSDFSIPILKTETVAAQSASIANVSGATLTWQAWKTSLSAAMSKAGL